MAVTVNLGRVQPIYRGPYSPSFPYRPLDFVTLDGVTFYCIKPVTGTPPPDTEFWVSILQLPLGIAGGGTGATTLEGVRQNLGVDERLPRDGSQAMNGPLDFGANKAVNLASGTDPDDAATVGQLDTVAQEAAAATPSGVIVMWHGAIIDIPQGWFLCDGNNGTPDLRDRFIVGAGDTYEAGDTGGTAEVTLTEAQMPAHSHTGSTNNTGNHTHSYSRPISGNSFDWRGGLLTQLGGFSTSSAGAHSHSLDINDTGGGEAHTNLPPYYALAYIMKG